MTAAERFLRYVTIDTQSDSKSGTYPSTEGQWVLARMLAEEMQALGITDAGVDEYGYVTGTLPANTEQPGPVLGFIAHMDTAEGTSGKNVRPQIVRQYDGGDIYLANGLVMDVKRFESLSDYAGQDLIVTDGSTLLGADDKAGVAEIMTMLECFQSDPALRHGTIKIAFTPDEEIAKGTEYFSVEKFGADFAYTVDGGKLGELEYENFNAATATVNVGGVGIHPSSAKNKMINAASIAMEFNAMLPAAQVPEHTEGYEGFYHLMHMEGTVQKARLTYILRDHDRQKFEDKKQRMEDISVFLNKKYGQDRVQVQTEDSYYNMREKILPHFHLIETAQKAMELNGIRPWMVPIRGGTDGARLSHMGLPCPNLSTGGHNFHGVYEYIPVQSLEKMVDVLCTIARLYGESSGGR